MGVLSNLWLFFGIVAFAATMGCNLFGLGTQGACSTYYNEIVTNGAGGLIAALSIITVAAGGIALASSFLFGTVSFPNPYTTFGAMTVFLLGIVVFPKNMFQLFLGVDPSVAPITQFLSAIFYLAWAYGAVAFLKGDL